jgi:hypothetical protein
MIMKLLRNTLALTLLAALASPAFAAPWTYNGQLLDNGQPASGKYDVRLTLVNDKNVPLSAGVTLMGVNVSNGLFSSSVDFGLDPNSLPGARLLTEVQQGNSGFFALGEAKAISGGDAECWDINGNTDLTIGGFPAFRTVGGVDNTINELVLSAGPTDNDVGPESTRLRLDTDGGIEQDTSQARGDGAVAWNNSFAEGPGSFTIGGGRTGPLAGNSFVYSNTAMASSPAGSSSLGYSNAPNEFLVKADGGVGFNAVPTNTVFDFVVGNAAGNGFLDTAFGIANGGQVFEINFIANSPANFISPTPINLGRNGIGANSINADFNAYGLALPDFVIRTKQSGPDDVSDLLFVTRATATTPERKGLMYLTTGGSFGFDPSLPLVNSEANRRQGEGVATLSAGGVWTNASSRSLKEGFASVNALDVLTKVAALPITTWTYKGSSEGTHMGPVAEDFKETFGLAGDGKSIGTVDANGVALAAIQGLNIKLTQAEKENAALKARLEALEAKLAD